MCITSSIVPTDTDDEGGPTITSPLLQGVIAIVRSRSELPLAEIIAAIRAGGVDLVELTLTTPGALAAVGEFRSAQPDVPLGMGSIRTGSDARRAIDAGATFLVTPTFQRSVLDEARRDGIPVACGAATPTEADSAFQAGADLIKIFPASTLGGARYLRELLAPMPDLPLAPTGGVTLESVPEYKSVGAVGLGVGSALFSDARFADGGLAAVQETARAFSTAWQ
jgi:2-dehydro-3-deoxyphosphogluconate aldolase/(4S)-4-hydroxy-2-oxoglutarate aldolase